MSGRMNHRMVPAGRSNETIRGRINLAEIFGPSLRHGASKAELRELATAAHREFQTILEARRMRRLRKMQAAEAALTGVSR